MGQALLGAPLLIQYIHIFLYTTLLHGYIWLSIQNTIRKKSAIYILKQDDSHPILPTPTLWEEHLFMQMG